MTAVNLPKHEGIVAELQQAYDLRSIAVEAVEGRRINVDLLQAESSRIPMLETAL